MVGDTELYEFRDGLSRSKFDSLVERLISNDLDNKSYGLTEYQRSKIFNHFDKDKDGVLNSEESLNLYYSWASKILKPRSALIVVDVQNDFISGSLSINKCSAGQHGEEVIPVINQLLDKVAFDLVVYTHDWHPEEHISFIDNINKWKVVAVNGEPFSSEAATAKVNVYDLVTIELEEGKIDQILWPRHCVQNTFGSSLHSELNVVPTAKHIYKGTSLEFDSYSAFIDNQKRQQTNLKEELLNVNITDVYVCGIAYDFCVRATALDANDLGFRTVLIEDACRGTDLDKIAEAKKSLIKSNCAVVDSNCVSRMVEAKDRRPELAWFCFEKHCLSSSTSSNAN